MLVNMGNWEEKTDLKWGSLRGHPQEHYDKDIEEDEERPMHCVVCITDRTEAMRWEGCC